MRLAALAFGHGIDIERIGGAVVAVFPHACEILTSGGRLITLASKSAGTLPGGITVDTPDDFEFARAVAPDAEAVTRAGVLRFSNSELTIDLRAAEPWHSGVRALALDLAQTPQRYLWEQAQEALRADGRIAPFLGIAAVAIGDLIDASHVFDDTKAQAAAARLIGLGDGTTPAGDDFLVGHLGGLWSSARGQPSRLDFAEQLGGDIVALAPRTHRVSRAYLDAAAAGELSERLSDVAAAIAGGSMAGAAEKIGAAIRVGHTSGACAVLGLLTGAAAFDDPALAHGLSAL